MIQDHPVNYPNQTGYEMMSHSGILVVRCHHSILGPIEGLMCFGEDAKVSETMTAEQGHTGSWQQQGTPPVGRQAGPVNRPRPPGWS